MPALNTTTANVSNSSSSPAQPLVSAGSHLPNPVTVIEVPLAAGVDGTFQSLRAMADAVRGYFPPDYSGYQDEANREAAEQIVQSVAGQNSRGEIDALYRFTRDQIVYRNHPLNQQRVQDAQRTIQLGSGDCVSKSVLLATLLMSLGYEARFVAQSSDGQEYSHVYVEAYDNQTGEWIALDPVGEDHESGWSQPLPNGGFETTWEIF